MPIYYNDKVYRNIPQQVGKNKEDIENLKETTYATEQVEELPETGEEKKVYLVPDGENLAQYIWENEEYVQIGSNPDLSHLPSPAYVTIAEKPEGLSYGLRIRNNGWTSDLQQEGGVKIELTGTSVKTSKIEASEIELGNASTAGVGKITLHNPEQGNQGDWYIGSDSQSQGLKLAQVGQTGITISRPKLEPMTSNYWALGSQNSKWKDLWLSGELKDGSNSIKINQIATKSDPSQPILVGSFNSTGTIDVAASTLPDGVYMFTYAYAQGIVYVNNTQITTATSYGAPIRADIPVVYSGYPTWEARPGNLRISKAADEHYLIQVSDGTHHAYEGAELYAIKINII